VKLEPREAVIAHEGQLNLKIWDLTYGDGIRVTVWSNQARKQSPPEALTVMACAGLGTPPESWPTLLANPEKYRIYGAYWRNTVGTTQPHGPIPSVEDHVADIIALMDSEGIDKAIFVGWSFGVNIACDAALDFPERVQAIMGVAGTPGDTFAGLLGSFPIPKPIKRRLGMWGSRASSASGRIVDTLAARTPVRPTMWALKRARFIMPTASNAYVEALLKHMLQHDFTWYFALAHGAGKHQRLPLEQIAQPVTLIGAKWDILTGAKEVRACAAEIPDCDYIELPGSHFLPAEFADECEQALVELAQRAGVLA
jgi:pimeloyl-ACP methyl ester carboxylesterase